MLTLPLPLPPPPVSPYVITTENWMEPIYVYERVNMKEADGRLYCPSAGQERSFPTWRMGLELHGCQMQPLTRKMESLLTARAVAVQMCSGRLACYCRASSLELNVGGGKAHSGAEAPVSEGAELSFMSELHSSKRFGAWSLCSD